MIYFGTRLSENISRREPEGYLLCLNVPVARTGYQEYLPEELGLPPGETLISVYRPPDEVFDPACIASFEGMPVTDDHPRTPDGVTAENIRFLQKGHAHNVRRGEGREADLLLADLIITDPDLSERILNGKREISCGYNYTLCDEGGKYIQRDIRGNHIAVVDAGRAGPRVSIKDAKKERRNPMTRSKNPNTLIPRRMAKLMAKMARDGETEELAEMISEIVSPDEDIIVVSPKDPVAEAVEEVLTPDEACIAPESATRIVTLLQEIISILTPTSDACKTRDVCGQPDPSKDACGSADPNAKQNPTDACGTRPKCGDEGEDPMVAAVAEAVVEAVSEAVAPETADEDPVEAVISEAIQQTLGEANTDEDLIVTGDPVEAIVSEILEPETPDVVVLPDRTADALRNAMSAFRPILKNMAPAARQQAVAKIAADLKAADKRNAKAKASDNYTRLIGSGAARREDPADLGKRIMAARNINYKK